MALVIVATGAAAYRIWRKPAPILETERGRDAEQRNGHIASDIDP
jgi:hypothetical protein